MADDPRSGGDASDILSDLLRTQTEMATAFFGQLMPGLPVAPGEAADASQWTEIGERMQRMWLDFQAEQVHNPANPPAFYSDPAKWLAAFATLYRTTPLSSPETQKRLWEDGLALWETVLGQYGIGPQADQTKPGGPELPRSDRRFASARWREHPLFAVIHQTYLMLAEHAFP